MFGGGGVIVGKSVPRVDTFPVRYGQKSALAMHYCSVTSTGNEFQLSNVVDCLVGTSNNLNF